MSFFQTMMCYDSDTYQLICPEFATNWNLDINLTSTPCFHEGKTRFINNSLGANLFVHYLSQMYQHAVSEKFDVELKDYESKKTILIESALITGVSTGCNLSEDELEVLFSFRKYTFFDMY